MAPSGWSLPIACGATPKAIVEANFIFLNMS
jgi:hypothetical protein